MSIKHKLRRFAGESYARVLFHTGLHALVDKIMPRRMLVLAGHCVSAPTCASLPKDMKIRGDDLERILSWLAKRYEVVTMAEGARRLQSGEGSRSLAVLTMDDGYRDNLTHLVPILQRVGVGATVYLESRPLDARRANWTHKLFWCLERMGPEPFVLRYTEIGRADRQGSILLNQLVPHGQATTYHIKRLLKYEVDPLERDRALEALYTELGGVDRELTDALYMTWDDVRALDRAGVEIGGHTVSHPILAKLPADAQAAEVRGCAESLQRGLGHPVTSFAYPFGRNWDFDSSSIDAARAAGFTTATTTHAGVQERGGDSYRIPRVMIDEDAQLHRIAAEACGGYALLRRIGIDLSA
ncbi:MAG: polysaccharide deacetylase family protein [Planctomycetota bacterium]|nr:polysaccharide deacetylase family protein [Planctomycetota bacterium]